MKPNFRIPSEDELRRMVKPESVCAYESMQAGLYRLKRLEITNLIVLPTGLSSEMNHLCNFVSCKSQDKENIERLEITGVGEPSGRGQGFSYTRTIIKTRPMSNSMAKKKTVINKGTTVLESVFEMKKATP